MKVYRVHIIIYETHIMSNLYRLLNEKFEHLSVYVSNL